MIIEVIVYIEVIGVREGEGVVYMVVEVMVVVWGKIYGSGMVVGVVVLGYFEEVI